MYGNKEIPLGPFPKGLNNVDSETDLPDGSLREATNVDISRAGKLSRRAGRTSKLSLTNSHSLFSNGNLTLLVDDGYIKRLWPDSYTLDSIAAVNGYISYADFLGTVYYSDDDQLRRVSPDGDSSPAWTPNPTGSPTVTASTGSLPEGEYQVAITNIGPEGEESGTDIAIPVTVTNGGIALTEIPQSDDADYVRIYLTSNNGSKLYAQTDIPMGRTSHTITQHRMGRLLVTMLADQMLAGHIVCHHFNRLYVAIDNTLLFSEAGRPGLTRLEDNYFPAFAGRIQIVMSHTTGLYVVAGGKTYFLAGANPDQKIMTINEVYPHGAAEGTGAYVSASILGLEQPGIVPYWYSDNGPVVGAAGGVVLPLTEKNLAVDKYEKGASLYREENGVRTLVTTVKNATASSRLGSNDNVSITVYRNGIQI